MDEIYLEFLIDYATSELQTNAKNTDESNDMRVVYLKSAIRILDKAVNYLDENREE